MAQEVSAHRLGDVLEALRPEVGHLKLEPRLDLPVSVFRQTNLTRLANPFEPGGDVDAVAHEVAVGLLDHVAKMNADAKLDTPFGGRPALRSTMPVCTSSAQRTASTTLRNSMIEPSPVRLMMRP